MNGVVIERVTQSQDATLPRSCTLITTLPSPTSESLLKKLLADAMLDNAALKDLLSKKW
jgi:hypothetical protein